VQEPASEPEYEVHQSAEKHSGITATARCVQLQEGARYGTIFWTIFGPTWASDIEITPRSDCKLGTLQIEGVKELTAERGRSLQRPTELPRSTGGRWFYIPGANRAAQ